MGAHKRGGFKGTRSSAPIMTSVCRIVNCEDEGYGRYCHRHVPAKGVGVIRCAVCNQPLAKHAITKTCLPS